MGNGATDWSLTYSQAHTTMQSARTADRHCISCMAMVVVLRHLMRRSFGIRYQVACDVIYGAYVNCQ